MSARGDSHFLGFRSVSAVALSFAIPPFNTNTTHHVLRMVLLVITDRILTALKAVPVSQRTELDLPTTLELHGPIAHEQLLRLAKHLQNDAEYNATQVSTRDGSPTLLSSLLRGTKVYVPPPPKKPEPVRATNTLNIQHSTSL